MDTISENDMPVFIPYFECVARYLKTTPTLVFGFIWRACQLDKHECYYSKISISRAIGVTPDRVRLAINQLLEEGLISETKHSDGRFPTHYIVNLEALNTLETSGLTTLKQVCSFTTACVERRT
jgi:hypothetical protein